MPLVFQVPVAVHVCVSVPQLPHANGSVWVGAQTPVHTPGGRHVWLAQAPPTHWPHVLQVCAALPEHCAAAGVHTGTDGHEQAPQVQVAWQVCVP